MAAYEIGFWICVFLILYPYLVYPLILAALARFLPRKVARGRVWQSVSVIVCAHNEQHGIERRILEFLGTFHRAGIDGEIVVVSDGSTDDTAAVIRLHTKKHVRLLELPHRVGKAEALNRGIALAKNEILVFADVRQTWADDALQKLLENFADPTIGAVSGNLVVTATPGTMSGVGVYWRYEKWIRRMESESGSQIGVTGAISACRRALYSPIPPGTVLDDVWWPMLVAMKGYRVVHDSRAVAYDRLPEQTRDEFRRKVRTLAGNFQLVARLPSALVPWRNRLWAKLVSHKLARLFVPWALTGLLVFGLLCDGLLYDLAFLSQACIYTLGLLGLISRRGGWLGSASSFLVLNAAAWVAFWVWITGRTDRVWGKVSYANTKDSAGVNTPLPIRVEAILKDPVNEGKPESHTAPMASSAGTAGSWSSHR